jgi:hypothetical protein
VCACCAQLYPPVFKALSTSRTFCLSLQPHLRLVRPDPTRMSTYVLPDYSREVPSPTTAPATASLPPTYSYEPHADEETVAMTPRAGVTSPIGHFTRQWPQATLILRDQDPQLRLPTYGRGGRIIGELGLKNPDKVDRVTVKVRAMFAFYGMVPGWWRCALLEVLRPDVLRGRMQFDGRG